MNTLELRSIRLEATSHCQLKCPSCPTASGEIRPTIGSGYLKFDDFRRLLEQNPEVEHVELSNYGEILLNPELLKIMEYADQRKVLLTAANGVNFNNAKDEVIEGLAKYQFRRLTVSLDGATQETYQTYRVRGDLAQVLANIRTLNKYKQKHKTSYPVLQWQFIVFGHNEHEIAQARQLAQELNMSFKPKLTWDGSFSPLRNPEMVKKVTGLVTLSRHEHEEKSGADYMSSICYQLWNQPQVNWDGKILGCCRNFWGDFGSNAFSEGLQTSLNSEKLTYARAMLQGEKEARPDIPCTSCDIYHKRRDKQNWLTPEKITAARQRDNAWISVARPSALYRWAHSLYRFSGARALRHWLRAARQA